MSIIRAPRPEAQFTIVHNDLIRDASMSLRARGLLVLLLSHDPGFRTDSVSLAKANPEGRDAIRTALDEIEGAGYLRRVRWQTARGRWRTDQFVFDRPVAHDFDPMELLAQLPVAADGALSTAPDVEETADEPLFEPAASPQVTPTTGFQAPVPPTPGQPTPDSQALTRSTNEKNSLKVGASVTTGRDARPAPPPKATPAPGLAALDRDDYGPLVAVCPRHLENPGDRPCRDCGEAREAFQTAEKLRAAARRREEAEQAVQNERRLRATRVPSSDPRAEERLRKAREALARNQAAEDAGTGLDGDGSPSGDSGAGEAP